MLITMLNKGNYKNNFNLLSQKNSLFKCNEQIKRGFSWAINN